MAPGRSKKQLIENLVLSAFYIIAGAGLLILLLNTRNVFGSISIVLALIALPFILFHFKRKYSMKKTIAFIFLGIIFTFTVLGSLAILQLFLINSNPGGYEYSISITGLNNYQGGLLTEVFVPMPLKNGEQAFSSEMLQYKPFGNWTTVVVVTKYGRMLGFQTTERNLSDIHANFFKSFPEKFETRNGIMGILSPSDCPMKTNYTQWLFNTTDVRNFTTLIYLDENMRPISSDNGTHTIECNLELKVFGGVEHSLAGDSYRVNIAEIFPEGTLGRIPVTAQVVGFINSVWTPLDPVPCEKN